MVFPSTACILQHKLGVARLPGLRRAGGVLGLRLRADGGRLDDPHRQRALRAGGRRRGLLAHPRLQRPHAPACCSATAPAPWCWRPATSPASWPATCMPTAAMSASCACPARCPAARCSGDPLLKMDGQAVFKLAVGVLDSAARAVLAKAGRTEADLDWLIPHQANIRIMQGTAQQAEAAAGQARSSPSTSTATPRPRRSRWRWTWRCAAAASSAATR